MLAENTTTHQFIKVAFLGQVEQIFDPVRSLCLTPASRFTILQLPPPPPPLTLIIQTLHCTVEKASSSSNSTGEIIKTSVGVVGR